MYVTLNNAVSCDPYAVEPNGIGYFHKLLGYFGKTVPDETNISFVDILHSQGLEDAIWSLRHLPGHDKNVVKFNLLCARRSEGLDPSGMSKGILDQVERHLNGELSSEQLKDISVLAFARLSVLPYDGPQYASICAAAYAASDVLYSSREVAKWSLHAMKDCGAEEDNYRSAIYEEIFGC